MYINKLGLERRTIKTEILCGLTVALALVPEAIAFALVAGVEPLVGLYAAFIVGLMTSVFGGRPGMISGATGALAVVILELVASHGLEYLFLAVILMGVIQVGVGLLRLGKFIRFMPRTVMIGFVNGLAIVIFLAQLGQFKAENAQGILQWMTGPELLTMIGLVVLTMLIIHFLPRLTKAIPAPLVAIVLVYLAVTLTGLETKTVGDIASIAGGLPQFSVPEVPFSLESLRIVLPYSIILAAIGLIESLMTLTRIDEVTETRGRANKECIGQGLANVVTGFFGGMGGCAMIGQSTINISSGGRKRLSGITAALMLLAFILFGSGLIEKIPLAALTGVMFMVVKETFDWSSFKVIKSIPKGDAFVIVLVSVVTVFTDLAVAVGLGVVVSALVFAWKKGKNIDIDARMNADGIKEYHIRGAIFFASARNLIDAFDHTEEADEVIMDFANARVFDHTGIEAVNMLTERYRAKNTKLHLRHLSKDCYKLIKSADDIVDVNIVEDPKYKVAEDTLA